MPTGVDVSVLDYRSGIREKLGVALFTVRESLSRDTGWTFDRIAELGYRNVEIFGLGWHPLAPDPLFGLSAAEYRKALSSSGLKMPSGGFFGVQDDIESIVSIAAELGMRYLVLGMSPALLRVPRFAIHMLRTFPGLGRLLQKLPISPDTTAKKPKSVEIYKAVAEDLNGMGAVCRNLGLRFAYHNHAEEFSNSGGFLPYDVLIRETDPDLVDFQLDVGWVAAASRKPEEFLEAYGERIKLCHLKDFNPDRILDPGQIDRGAMSRMDVPGRGIVNFDRLLEQIDEHGIQYAYVECDEPVHELETLQKSFSYLVG